MRATSLLLALGCASVPRGHQRTQLSNCAATDGEIVCDGHRFAQVLCVVEQRHPDVQQGISGVRAPTPSCRALGVRYFDDDEVLWLYRAGGFDPDHPDVPYSVTKADMRFAYAVTVSPSEGKLRYQTKWLGVGGLKKREHEYDLFAGTLRDN